MGSVNQIVEKIIYQHKMFGQQRYISQLDSGGIPKEKIMDNIEVLGTEIMPRVRKHLGYK